MRDIGFIMDITLQIRPMKKDQQPTQYFVDRIDDVEFANQLARLESYNKHYYRPNSYLHKWWARRCGTTFRFILKQLVPAAEKRGYYTSGGLEGKLILDPMIGGGTTLHEAVRLGSNVIGIDLDPIPILQARATLTHVPLAKLEAAFREFFNALRDDLAPLFVTSCDQCAAEVESWYTLYGARRFCACGEILMIDSYIVRRESDGTSLRLCPDCRQLVRGSETCGCQQHDGVPLVERKVPSCTHCGEVYREDLSEPYFRRYEPLVVAAHCSEHGLFLRALDDTAYAVLRRADDLRATVRFNRADFAVQAGHKSIQLHNHGIDSYLDLFSSRQLLFLQKGIDLLPQFDEKLRLNLALLLSTSLEFNSLLCGYKGKSVRRPGAVRHVFAHHAYSFPYTALENNPIYHRRASGTVQNLFHKRIRRARKWAEVPRERDLSGEKGRWVELAGEHDFGTEVEGLGALRSGTRRFLLQQGSATVIDLPDGSVDFVITDPPYFDSVQYSDLSAYFRVWLRQMLPDAANWDIEVRESAVGLNDGLDENRYAALITDIFTECHRVLRKREGRLIFTFHHWNPLAWASLTEALQAASFTLLNYAVVHSENPISVHIAGMDALIDDAILVLAPAERHENVGWQRPQKINMSGSAQFCADCAMLLGWLLDEGLPRTEIHQSWLEGLALR